MSKPEVFTVNLRLPMPGGCPDYYLVENQVIRLSDHEAAIKAERQTGFAAAFDVLTYRAANTDNDILAEELDDLAHDLLESAPDWKDRWKQIHKMNEERAADKARIAELENSAASALAVAEGGNQSHNMQVIGRILREALAQQGKEQTP